MPQVLDTPDIRDEQERIADEESLAPSPERSESAPEKTHQPTTLLRSILSVFTASQPDEYIPKEYSPILERPEPPIDYLCRTDPYLCMRALSG